MPTSNGTDSGYLRLLLARKGWILASTGLVLASAVVFSLLQTPTYKSEATVLVQPRLLASGTPVDPEMGTEKQVAMSIRVATLSSSKLGVPLEHVRDGLSVAVPVETTTLVFAYVHTSRAEAQRRAETFAESYVQARSGKDVPRVPGQSGGPLPVVPWTFDIITPADLPRAPVSPNYAVNLAVALVVGLALGLASAFVRDYLDDRLRGAADLEAQTNARVLAVIPRMASTTNDAGELLVTFRAPNSPAAEAYHYLCRKVLQAATKRGASMLVVTSALAGDGKTTTAANLAVAYALSGKRVTLVCGDLSNPRLHEFFGVRNDVGLVHVLIGHVTLQAALRDTGVPGLRLLPGSPVSSYSVLLSPSELLSEALMKDILAPLSDDADLVVIDSAPILSAAGTLSLVELADMTLLVVDARRSTRALVHEVRLQLESVRASLIGTVRNNASGKDNGALPSYAYRNGYGPRSDESAQRRSIVRRR